MTDWFGLYGGRGWKGEIVPEAFSHPAKVSRGLARKIYAYAIENGWLKEGGCCLDPFAGIGGFALDAMFHGLHFIGCELEDKFVQLGQQNIDLWNRRYGGGKLRRWGTATILQGDSRRLCEMLEGARAEGVISSPPWADTSDSGKREWIAEQMRTGKMRTTASGDGIGSDSPSGTLDGYGTDLSNLGNMPTGEPPSAVISSPPWEQSGVNLGDVADTPGMRQEISDRSHKRDNAYGSDPAQLGNMPTGEPPSAIVSSPPFAESQQVDNRKKPPSAMSDTWRKRFGQITGGTDPANLGNMPIGEPPQAVIGSPPYIDSMDSPDKCGIDWERAGRPDRCRPSDKRVSPQVDGGMDYGSTDGQLGAMREGDVPTDYTHTPGSLTSTQFDARAVTESATFTTAPKREEAVECEWEGDDVDAVIASPPWLETVTTKPDGEYGPTERGLLPDGTRRGGSIIIGDYGQSDGQLAALPEGEPPQIDARISSPPYEGSLDHAPGNKLWDHSHGTPGNLKQAAYSTTSAGDNLGNQQSNTFWSAARTILLQCHQVLAPGGVAIFVCKRFVRDKKIVEFSQQWADLCQSCGFELVEWIKAWLVEERGTQYDLTGEAHTKIVKRFSFFRRLHAQKYPHLAIEWEDVLIFRKPV